MLRCPSCAAEVPTGQRFCGGCGKSVASADASQLPTEAMALPARTPAPSHRSLVSHSSTEEGRFPAGTILAERYRVTGLLGQGGMGEVYRANDLKLGQPVALKFLPAGTSESLLERFHSEVRIARQVSHPNVCRVYDIGEIDGSTFLSMEYVDGEDLRSLLRRIGRLPGDKAIEFARRLCAGLAAAHDKGVIHRDLKPANIMIDGRGQVMITDFGLAGLAGQIQTGDIRSGTPAYMAPEQLAGKEVTTRSDIYALGLVLHEMFTGKPVFQDGTSRTTPANLSPTAKDIDPAVERVILRCLAPDPQNRPKSALAVAAALPGGDPLAAALAAGETPTPEMVAAAGDTEGLSIRAIWICLGVILVGFGVVSWGSSSHVFRKIPFPMSTAALEQKARDVVHSLGYTDPYLDSAYGLSYLTGFKQYAERQEKPETYRAQLGKGMPSLVTFWYRQSPQYLEILNAAGVINGGVVTMNDPPPGLSGQVSLRLDPEGRLIQFDAIPLIAAKSNSPPDWTPLLTASGLDMSRFTRDDPVWLPPVRFDGQAAWIGSLAHAPEVPMRIEAASWGGKPVFFRVLGPWNVPGAQQGALQKTWQIIAQWVILALVFTVLGFAALLAVRSIRSGRGDLKGAGRLAVFVFCVEMLWWLLASNHTPSTGALLGSIFGGLSASFFWAGVFWAIYIAVEPYVRRRWPQSMITWTRLLAGDWRDPLVGGHVLMGVALGIGLQALIEAQRSLSGSLPTNTGSLNYVQNTPRMISALLTDLLTDIGLVLIVFLTFSLFRTVVRREWLAIAVVVLVFASVTNASLAERAVVAVLVSAFLFINIRFGVLPVMAAAFVGDLMGAVPINFTAWYAGSAMFALAVVLALTAYALRTAIAGRPLFKSGFLESD